MIKTRTILALLALTKFIATASAQEVIIPDPGLNAAVRATLNKPSGPLTQQDMLGLTVLNAHDRNISDLTGLEAARNLNTLLLFSNHITNFSLPADLRALSLLDLGENQLRNVNLPAGLGHLNNLRLSGNTNLTSLTLPVGMTNLSGIFLRFNALTNLTLPPDLFRLATLDILGNQLTHLDLPSGMTNLVELILARNQLTNLTLRPDMIQLTSLVLGLPNNPLTQLVLSEAQATNLVGTIVELQNQGIPVFKYPLTVRLAKQASLASGAFLFALTGVPLRR